MSQIRYFVIASKQQWTIRRDCRWMAAFDREAQAVATALQMAAIDRVRSNTVEVLKQEADGRWLPCGASNAHLCDTSR